MTREITIVVMDALTFEPCIDCTVEAKGNGSNSGEYKLNENGEVSIEYKKRVVLTGQSPKKNYFGNFNIFKKKHKIERDTLWVYPDENFEKNYFEEQNCQSLKDSLKDPESPINIYNADGKYNEAVFRNGPKEMHQFINSSLIYPETSIELGDQGKVFTEFIVDDSGQVKCPQILKGVSKELDAEALRVVRKMSNWKPATIDGEPIPIIVRLPLGFRLN